MLVSVGALSPTEAAEEGGKKGGQRRGLMANMMALRQRTAQGFRQLAEVTADHLSRQAAQLQDRIPARPFVHKTTLSAAHKHCDVAWCMCFCEVK